jgi:hypothetical protein
MKHARLIVSAGIVYSVIGCGSQPSQQTIAPPPQPQPIAQGTAQSPSPAAQINEVVPPSREAQPDLITKQAEAHAKAIEALLAARARTDAESHGAKIIEPTPPEKMDPEARMVALAPAPAAGGITGVVRTEQTDARPPTER